MTQVFYITCNSSQCIEKFQAPYLSAMIFLYIFNRNNKRIIYSYNPVNMYTASFQICDKYMLNVGPDLFFEVTYYIYECSGIRLQLQICCLRLMEDSSPRRECIYLRRLLFGCCHDVGTLGCCCVAPKLVSSPGGATVVALDVMSGAMHGWSG
jgi:hypothetical protein